MPAGLFGKQIGRRDDGALIGINLGHDACTEHECGIRPIKEAFKIPFVASPDCFGADARTVRSCPEKTLKLFEFGTRTYLVLAAHFEWDNGRGMDIPGLDHLCGVRYARDGETFSASWDGLSPKFAICIFNDELGDLRRMYEAFCALDMMIYTTSAGPFGGSGLCLVIRSMAPTATLEQMAVVDLDQFRLTAAFEATGITEQLKRAGRKYYGLQPRWANAEKTEIEFYLNPMGTQTRSGRYSLEDLTDWCNGKGRVLYQTA